MPRRRSNFAPARLPHFKPKMISKTRVAATVRARDMKGIVLAGGSFAGDQQAVAGLSQADVHPLTTLMLAGVLAFLAAFTSWSYFDARQHS